MTDTQTAQELVRTAKWPGNVRTNFGTLQAAAIVLADRIDELESRWVYWLGATDDLSEDIDND